MTMTTTELEKTELEKHIERFPSPFDRTSIGGQLRDANVSVQLYAEIRDVLWNSKQDLCGKLLEASKLLGNINDQIAEFYETL